MFSMTKGIFVWLVHEPQDQEDAVYVFVLSWEQTWCYRMEGAPLRTTLVLWLRDCVRGRLEKFEAGVISDTVIQDYFMSYDKMLKS